MVFWSRSCSRCQRRRSAPHRMRSTTNAEKANRATAGHITQQAGRAASFVDKSVAYAAQRVEISGGGAELFAEAAHVRVHGARVNGRIVAPDVAEKLLARLDPAPALGQDGEQFEFGGRQVDGLVLHADHMARDVQE